MTYPKSPYESEGELIYFPRMLDKIRLQAKGELPEEYHALLGRGFDGRLCWMLGVDYEALKEQVLSGASDAEVLAWCRELGRDPGEQGIVIWNGFVQSRGRKDVASDTLQKFKAASGLADRTDIETFLDYFEVDEGRKA